MRFRLKPTCSLHSARIGGRKVTVRPGDVVECEKTELGNWASMYDQLDPDPPEPPPTINLVKQSRGDGAFDVVNTVTGSRLNTVPLSEEAANAPLITDGGQDTSWKIPHVWNDECFILGGGPSLRLVDLDRLRGKAVIAVNNAYLLRDWLPVMFFGDKGWYQTHRERLRQFGGLKVTAVRLSGREGEQKSGHAKTLRGDGVKVVERNSRVEGISTKPTVLNWNRSSGACAINLAVLLGACRLVLFGFDMRPWSLEELTDRLNRKQATLEDRFGYAGAASRANWHRDHSSVGNPKHDPYPGFLEPFERIAADLSRLKIDCVNATPGSALTVFPIVDPEDVS